MAASGAAGQRRSEFERGKARLDAVGSTRTRNEPNNGLRCRPATQIANCPIAACSQSHSKGDRAHELHSSRPELVRSTANRPVSTTRAGCDEANRTVRPTASVFASLRRTRRPVVLLRERRTRHLANPPKVTKSLEPSAPQRRLHHVGRVSSSSEQQRW